MVKRLIRAWVPESLIGRYHFWLAKAAAMIYRHPANELVVIGVTGTNGKSSTTEFVGRLLEFAGARVGWTGTASFKVGQEEWMNDKKMTMLGRFATQKLLRRMVKAGCAYAVVETSSQGISQFRHIGINYDVAVFTNLTPEHIEAHGGFESYKQAKKQLFIHTKRSRRKKIQGHVFEKTAVVNVMSPYASEFLGVGLDRAFGFGIEAHLQPIQESRPLSIVPVLAEDVVYAPDTTGFVISGVHMRVPLTGRFYLENTLAAVAVCRALGLDWDTIKSGVAQLKPVPGRFERIEEGQPFSVVVDYAYEPAALMALYETVRVFPHKRIIHVVGSAGGGRDVARRPILGELCAKNDHVVIVTNEDPYDDDPQVIIDQIANAATLYGKRDGVDLFRIADRREAIYLAIHAAQPGDVVLITGKGCEPVMAVANGELIPWDDRAVAREALRWQPESV